MNIVDSHHHMWKYSPEAYPWIEDNMMALQKDHLLEELKTEAHNHGVRQTVAVQARTIEEESTFLLDLASQSDLITGVVGWLDLSASHLDEKLSQLKQNKKFKGLREVCQGEADGFMLRKDFLNGLKTLFKHDCSYDILIFEHQLAEAIEMVDRFPNERFVLDHLAKPKIKNNETEPWAAQLKALSERENVFCKISGMVTEADLLHWKPEHLTPYMDIALNCFGPQRLMFGSDWPVCQLGASYQQWLSTFNIWLNQLNSSEQASIAHQNAINFYQLPTEP